MKLFSNSQLEIQKLKKELSLKNNQIRQLKASLGKDILTGLYKWQSKIAQEILLDKLYFAGRQKVGVWLCLADIDYLKIVNDSFSMKMGDEVIKLVGDSINFSLRGINNTFKYGADEFPFIVILEDDSNLPVIFERIYKKFQSLLAEKRRLGKMSTELAQVCSFSCGACKIKSTKNFANGGFVYESVGSAFDRVDKLMHERAKKNSAQVSFFIEGHTKPLLFGEKYDLSRVINKNSEYKKRYKR